MKRADLKVGMHVAIGKANPSRWDGPPKEAIVTNVQSGPTWSRFSRHTHPSKSHVGIKFVKTADDHYHDDNEFGVVLAKIRGPWDESIAAYNRDQADQKERERIALDYQANTKAKNTARWLKIATQLGPATPASILEAAGKTEWQHSVGKDRVDVSLDDIETMLARLNGRSSS